ncbi:molybdate ABC transporter substrate-binding protein [Robiginitalea marina]|uniref:Molybdate ABC transporter substrate-binding protein n=1 Tax=Robiginitalea marina TaxID=2954105 RepID=A0ABT1AXI5_9FLAO|nr:molybdate ABC transporter substrate-binding protein [Robiginitalea marina]MCO5724073.1 molybdate ABC transporter substrate-binding protein [Robiginitalea marina]
MAQKFLISILLILAASCGPRKTGEGITLAVAANMQYAMEEIAGAFTEQTGIPCELVVSSSGKLTAQIREGAPFDVFISADLKYPRDLEASGLATLPPEVYAYGKLVLWTLEEGLEPSLEVLTSDAVRHIALANPKTAPYGQAAMETLERTGLLEPVRNKLVYGESISQTNQFITSRAAEIGFTALAVVRSPEMRDQGAWIAIDPGLYQPIAQGIVLVRHPDRDPQRALAFYTFVFSTEAKAILKRYGYTVNE